MTITQRDAWQAVSSDNLQAAIEDLIRAHGGNTYVPERIIEQATKRVLATASWER